MGIPGGRGLVPVPEIGGDDWSAAANAHRAATCGGGGKGRWEGGEEGGGRSPRAGGFHPHICVYYLFLIFSYHICVGTKPAGRPRFLLRVVGS